MTKRKRRSAAPAERWEALADLGLTTGQRRLLLWVGSVVGVLGGALALTLVVDAVAGGHSAPASAPDTFVGQSRPSSYQGWRSPTQFTPIATRGADPKPLSVPEIFGARTFSAGRITLRRVSGQVDQDCARVVWGAALGDALSQARCTQAVRGLYRTADGGYVAQYTLFNVADMTAANKLADALTTLYRAGWVLPLNESDFTGYSEASGHAMGHYLGLVWIARADGAEPREQDDFVMLGLAVREAEKALYRRVVAVAGLPQVSVEPVPSGEPAQPSEPAPTRSALVPPPLILVSRRHLRRRPARPFPTPPAWPGLPRYGCRSSGCRPAGQRDPRPPR